MMYFPGCFGYKQSHFCLHTLPTVFHINNLPMFLIDLYLTSSYDCRAWCFKLKQPPPPSLRDAMCQFVLDSSNLLPRLKIICSLRLYTGQRQLDSHGINWHCIPTWLLCNRTVMPRINKACKLEGQPQNCCILKTND
jgi:hypothetical protein